MKRLILGFVLVSAVVSIAPSQVTQDWVKTINGNGWKSDHLYGYSVDASGNVYVTGSTPPLSGSIEDAVTIKYNSSGAEQWRARYDAGYGSDYGKAVTVDGSGNVYVAAYSRGSVNVDCAIIKYNASGSQQWVTRYNGPANSYDDPKAIALNSTGYLCVTGKTSSAGAGFDIATIFLDAADGTLVIQDIYDGPGNNNDEAAGLAIDGSGNFFVVGTSQSASSLSSEDFVTIKYDNNATLQWSRRYNGTGNYVDEAAAVAADASGNAYVVGLSSKTGSGNNDYATIKYNAAGDSVWVRRIDFSGSTDQANAVAVDGSGNVYVTGFVTDVAAGYFDALTVKYTSAGDTAWTRRYGAGTSIHERANGIGVDGTGNVYVAGTTLDPSATPVFLARYSPTGSSDWSTTYSTTQHAVNEVAGLVVNSAGTCVVFGSTQGPPDNMQDFLMLKYDNAGQSQWASTYAAYDNAHDYGYAMALDDSGYVYVTGATFWSNAGYDNITTAKLQSNGDTAWVRYYNGGSSDIGRDIAVDAQGNVFVTGETYQSSAWKTVTLKYDPYGVQQWAQVYGSGNGDVPAALALDAAGNVIVTGKKYTGSYDYLTLKYNSAGSMIGSARIYNPSVSSGNDEAHMVIAGGSNDFYVVGRCAPSNSLWDMNFGIVKYGGIAGTQQWAFQYSGPGAWNDDAVGICRDSAGYLYVVGPSWRSTNEIPGLLMSNTDIVVLKMTSAGDTLWSRVFGGPSYREDYPMAIVYDGHGGLYISGATYNLSPPNDMDMTIMRIDTGGSVLWEHTYNRPGGNDDECPAALAVDSAGNAYLAGTAWWKWSAQYVPSKDMTLLRYDRITGTLAWSAFHNGTANSFDAARDIVVDKTGNIFIAGGSAESQSGNDMSVLRFSQTIALPVEMTQLTSSVDAQGVMLRWSTATEEDNLGFEIERRKIVDVRLSSSDYQKLAFIPGAGTSTAPKEYSFSDVPGIGRFAYRLKQIDRNGSFTYSHEAEVEVGIAPKELTLSRNYPNPFNPSTTIEFSVAVDGRAALKVFDMLGREVATLVDGEVKAGTLQQATFDATGLSSGVYIVRLESAGLRSTRTLHLLR